MARIVLGRDTAAADADMDAAFRLRHRVFVEELGWAALRRPDGRETDRFDTADAVHVLAYRGGRVVGYARLLPTLAPHILSEVFPWLCGEAGPPRGPDVMEWTRQCVCASHRGGAGVSDVHAELILAVLEWCLDHDVTRLTAEGSPAWIGRFRTFGMTARALGPLHPVEGVPVCAMLFEFDRAVLAAARRLYGVGGNVAAHPTGFGQS